MRKALVVLAVATGVILVSSIAAAAQGPVRSEMLYAGAYRLRVDLYSDPPFTGRRFDFDVVVSADRTQDVQGVTVTALAIPDPSTNAVETLAILMPAGSTAGGFKGSVNMAVRGGWVLRFTVSGKLGTNTVGLPLQVAAPAAIPVELGWAIALAPLLILAGFLVEQRSYLRKLQIAPGG